MNLKVKNTLITMAVLSVLLLTVVGITYRSTTAIVDQTMSDHQKALAADAAKTTELWLNQQMKILNATASSIDYALLGNNDSTLRPLQMAMKAGHFSDVYIGTSEGILIDGAYWIPPVEYDPRVRPWYQRALETGGTAFTTPYIDLVTMEMVIALVTPLEFNGQFIGVMGADTILDSLVETLLSTKVGETGYLFVAHKRWDHPDPPGAGLCDEG